METWCKILLPKHNHPMPFQTQHHRITNVGKGLQDHQCNHSPTTNISSLSMLRNLQYLHTPRITQVQCRPYRRPDYPEAAPGDRAEELPRAPQKALSVCAQAVKLSSHSIVSVGPTISSAVQHQEQKPVAKML